MRVNEVLKIKGTNKQEFTKLARVAESIRKGTTLSDGSNLKNDWSEKDKKIAEEHIILELMPVIDEISKEKSRKHSFNFDKEENYHQILLIMVFEEFPKFNKIDPSKGEQKTFEIEAFLGILGRASYRSLLAEEYGVSEKTVINMNKVNRAWVEVLIEGECRTETELIEKIYMKMKDSGMSKDMIYKLYMLLSGKVSIETIPNFEELLVDENSDVELNARFGIDAKTKEKMDAVFATLSDVELFILMRKFDLLGVKIGRMTIKEISCQDYYVEMARKDKRAANHIEFGNVRIQHPERNTRAEELLLENVYYVKEKYYQNTSNKIDKKLETIENVVKLDDVKGCLEEYCYSIWHERGLDKMFCRWC